MRRIRNELSVVAAAVLLVLRIEEAVSPSKQVLVIVNDPVVVVAALACLVLAAWQLGVLLPKQLEVGVVVGALLVLVEHVHELPGVEEEVGEAVVDCDVGCSSGRGGDPVCSCS